MSPSFSLAVESGFVATGVMVWIIVAVQSFSVMLSWGGFGDDLRKGARRRRL